MTWIHGRAGGTRLETEGKVNVWCLEDYSNITDDALISYTIDITVFMT